MGTEMTLLRPTPVSTRQLDYNRQTKIFVAEASTVGIPGRVYDDACDTGYTLVSHTTGREVVVAETNRVYDNEGDFSYAEFEPVRVGAPEFTLRVFND